MNHVETFNLTPQGETKNSPKKKNGDKSTAEDGFVSTLSDEWDHFDSDEEPTVMEQYEKSDHQRRRPVTPPSEEEVDEEKEKEKNAQPTRNQNINTQSNATRSLNNHQGPKNNGVPTKEEIRALFVRSGMSDRTVRLCY